jgi:hypothetical protein
MIYSFLYFYSSFSRAGISALGRLRPLGLHSVHMPQKKKNKKIRVWFSKLVAKKVK